MGKRKHKFIIRYKSGAEVAVRADNLAISLQGGALTEIEWVDMSPRPLYLGVDNVESVWQVK